MKAVDELTDSELKAELATHGFTAPPITGTTKAILQKKLEAFRSGSDKITKPKSTAAQQRKNSPGRTAPAPTLAVTPAKAQPTSTIKAKNDTTFDGSLDYSRFQDNGLDSTTSSSILSSSRQPPASAPTPPMQPSPRSPLRMFSGTTSTTSTSTSTLGANKKPIITPAKPTSSGRISTGGDSSGYTFPSIFDGKSAERNRLSDIGPIGEGAPRANFQDSFERDRSGYGQSLFDDPGEDDDHMESSRIVSPRSRFQPTTTGPSANKQRPTTATTAPPWRSSYGSPKQPSPVEKFKNFGRSAWGFFSRPLGTSTPCSDTGFKYAGYTATPANRYRRDYGLHEFGPKRGGADGGSWMPAMLADTSHWIAWGIMGFLVLLAASYVYQAKTEAVHSALHTGKDVVIGTFNFLYSYAIFPVGVLLIVLFVVFMIFKLFDLRRQRKADAKKRLIQLVERITDIIYEAGPAGIAEPHVRDMLMPPTKRSEDDYKNWQQAARFINNEDSRIRTEIRLIDGMECNVWIWTGTGKQRWQGTAVAEGSPMARVPEQALTRCLKLRGLNFTSNRVEQQDIRNELLAKLKPVVPKHLGFVDNNVENVVYMMLNNYNDAKRAFFTFHSHWFNGNMITVKYVREERYLERFPDADG